MPKRRHIAVLIETSRAYGRGLLRGVTNYVHTSGRWSVYLQERAPSDSIAPWFRDWQGDGVIARIENRAMERAILDKGLPAVDLRGLYDLNMPLIETDDRAVAELAYEHLAERGFRHFAYCGFAGTNYSERRLKYFPPLAEAAGRDCHVYLAPTPSREVEMTLSEQTALLFEAEMVRWLADLPKPIGVMCCNDICGQQVLNACREMGIRVPDEVAVIGVDNDTVHCELSDPPLSSVMPNTRRIGYLAAELLDRMIDGEPPGSNKIFIEPTGIVTRLSTDVLAIDDPDIIEAVRFIREHACEGINVDDVVKHVPLSRRVLERRFRAILDRSPNEEIVRMQISRVKQLLTGTELPLTSIAQSAGFKHVEYMSTVFSKLTGAPPSRFRAETQR